MRKDHLPLPSFFRGKLAVKDSGGVNLWSVRKKQKFWKKLQAFCGQTATKKKHPHPPKKFNCSTPQDWASYWWEHLGSLHCAGGTGPFRRVSFGAKVSRFRFVFGRVRTCWWSKKNWCRYHQFEGTRGASPLLLLMVQKSSTPVEVGS